MKNIEQDIKMHSNTQTRVRYIDCKRINEAHSSQTLLLEKKIDYEEPGESLHLLLPRIDLPAQYEVDLYGAHFPLRPYLSTCLSWRISGPSWSPLLDLMGLSDDMTRLVRPTRKRPRGWIDSSLYKIARLQNPDC